MGKNVHKKHVDSRLHKWDAVGSGRGRTMPHIKTVCRYRIRDPSRVDWLYLGSANLSSYAWGSPQKNNSCLAVQSFELGVLFLPSLYCKSTFSVTASIPRGVSPVVAEERELFCFEAYRGFQKSRPSKLAETAVEGQCLTSVPLPIPYSLPPVKYDFSDVAWHVDAPKAHFRGPVCKVCSEEESDDDFMNS